MKLPNKASELIRVAIADLRKVEKSKAYEVNMAIWHSGVYKSICDVCFAGAVMAKTLKTNIKEYYSPDCFADKTSCKLEALNQFRLGYCRDAFDYLSESYKSNHPWDFIDIDLFNRNIKSYYVSPTRFKKDMLNLAQDLENFGL